MIERNAKHKRELGGGAELSRFDTADRIPRNADELRKFFLRIPARLPRFFYYGLLRATPSQ